jgi:hypothetical protein
MTSTPITTSTTAMTAARRWRCADVDPESTSGVSGVVLTSTTVARQRPCTRSKQGKHATASASSEERGSTAVRDGSPVLGRPQRRLWA